MYIHKNILQVLLPHARNILENFGLQGGHPSSSLRSEPVHNIMELDGFRQAPVNYDDDDDLPEHFHKAYSIVITPAIGYKDYSSPCALRCQLPYHKRQLYYIHNNPPPVKVRVFLFPLQRKPSLHVVHPHP